MSDTSRQARRAMRAKAHRMATGSAEKVDASDFTPAPELRTDAKTGARPISRRAYKSGGKVEGEKAPMNAGKKPRTGNKSLTADTYINRDVKEANKERDGYKHVGAFKRGGRAKRADGGDVPSLAGGLAGIGAKKLLGGERKRGGRANGGEVPTTRFNMGANTGSRMTQAAGLKKGGAAKHSDEAEDRKLIDKMVKKDALTGKNKGGSISDGSLEGTRPTGGRLARKNGGGNWIKDAIKHPGALHRELHIPEGEKIPAKKLKKAEHSDDPKLAKRARLAETLGRMHRKSGGRTGKTDINIVIGRPSPAAAAPMGAPAGGPGGVAPVPVGPAGLGAMGPAIPTSGAMPASPAQQPMPMARKAGGRTVHMTAGAKSGLGRLQKAAIAKRDREA